MVYIWCNDGRKMATQRCEKHTVEALFFAPKVDTVPLFLSTLVLGVLLYDLETRLAAYDAVERATL